jgi:hypothetical protein
VSRTKRLLGPKSQILLWALTASTPPVPSPRASDPGGQEPQAPEPMEIDPPDPSRRVWTVHRSVYYNSEVLQDAKTRYLDVH